MQDKKAIRLAPFIIKTLLVVLTFGFLYFEIFQKHEMNDLVHLYRDSYLEHSLLYWTLLLLMLVNWSFETKKWMYMLPEGLSQGFFESFKAVWTGVAVSLFTPNRVGEFGGRMLCFEPGDRVKAVSASLAGSLGQLTSTMLFGIIGGTWYLIYGGNDRFTGPSWLPFLSIVIFALILILYFNIRIFSHWLEKRRWHKLLSETMEVLSSYSRDKLFVNLWFSALRYLVFALQMGLALYVLVEFVDFKIIGLIAGIFTYFLFQTALPSIALSEIGVRGAVLAFLLAHTIVGDDITGLVLAGTLIWFINIIIPAIVGAFFLLRVKIKLAP